MTPTQLSTLAAQAEAPSGIAARVDAPVLKRLLEERAEALERLEDLAVRVERQITDDPERWLPDHACIECVPWTDCGVVGFQCARHAALSFLLARSAE